MENFVLKSERSERSLTKTKGTDVFVSDILDSAAYVLVQFKAQLPHYS